MSIKYAYRYINGSSESKPSQLFIEEDKWIDRPDEPYFDIVKETKLENDSETLPAFFNLPPVTVRYQYVGSFTETNIF